MTLYKICTICTLYLSMFQAPGESVAHPVLTVHKMYTGWNFSDNKKLGHPKSASVLHYSAPQCKCEKHKLYLLWVHIFSIQKSLNKVEQLLFCTAEEKLYKLFLMTSSCKGGYNQGSNTWFRWGNVFPWYRWRLDFCILWSSCVVLLFGIIYPGLVHLVILTKDEKKITYKWGFYSIYRHDEIFNK